MNYLKQCKKIDVQNIFLFFALLTLIQISGFAQEEEWIVYNPQNSGLSDTNVLSLAMDDEGVLWVGTKYSGLIKFNGDKWISYIPDSSNMEPLKKIDPDTKTPEFSSPLGPQINAFYDVAIDASGVKWLGTKIGGLFKLVGTTWKVYSPDNSEIPDVRAWTVTLDSQGRKWIGTKTGGVAVFDNLNWIIYNKTNSLLPDNDVYSIFIDKAGIKWIGTYNGLAVLNNSTWTIYQMKNSGLPVNTVSSIAIDEAGAKWIGTLGGGLVKFSGSTWKVFNSSNSGLPDDDIWKVATDLQGNVWIGTLNAGLVKFDGEDWDVFNPNNSNFPSNNVWDILIDINGNKWVATSLGLAFLGDKETTDPEKNRTGYFLSQNFPNPFNSSTMFTFYLPVETDVRISVYNVLGAQVQVLANSVYGQGAHQVHWEGKNSAGDYVPSGTYFCRLKTNNTAITKKMLLMR